ncbi:glycosyltransferase family 4 protein [Candidatus Sumerlaeota bacterium]|nr:glycosyltransferase family 4 protein [Candidatus Sumerlaeota bacterium]
MRILTISNCPLLEYQGSGYIIVNYARQLRELGHDVELHGPEDYELFHGRVRRGKFYRQALGMKQLALKRTAAENFDVVEFYGSECHSAVKALQARRDRKFITVLHSNGLELNVRETLARFSVSSTPSGKARRFYNLTHDDTIRSLYKNVDGLVLLSKYEEEYARRNGFTGRFGSHGVTTPLPELFLGVTPTQSDTRTIGFCGSWIERKGITAIREAASKLLMEFPDWRLLLVGVGDNFNVKANFPEVAERVQVIGFVKSKEQVMEAYQRMSLLLVPSYYESFGLVTAEAMACGVAVVASRTGFAWELKDRGEAMLLDAPNAQEIYRCAHELMSDSALRGRIAMEGWRRAQDLQWRPAAQRVHDLYADWLARHRAGAR